MTGVMIPMEQDELDALFKVAATIGVSSEALAHGAVTKMLDELTRPQYEPFETEEEAADFVTARFKEALDETR